MKYEYFISYAWSNDIETGFGNCSIKNLKKPIESIEGLKNIAEQIINEYKLKQVTILNFILLKTIREKNNAT